MAATYEPLATTTLSGSTNSVTFSSISQNYTDLVLVFSGSISASLENILIEINSDTGSNYSNTYVMGNGSTTSSGRNSNQTKWYAGAINTTKSTGLFYFMNYSNTTTNKTVLHRMNNSDVQVAIDCLLYRSTSAITTIKVSNTNTYSNGTMISLYGIKAA